MTYETSAHAPREVKAELCQIWRDNLQDVAQSGAETKFAWLYEDSPFDGARVYFANTVGNPIGTCALQTRRFSVNGEVHTTGLLADLAIDKHHRTGAPALQLLRRIHADSAADFPLTLGFPNAKAMAVFKRAGFSVLGHMQRYAVILRHEKYVPRAAASISMHLPPALSRWVEEQTKSPVVQKWLGTAADWATMALRATATRHAIGEEPLVVHETLPAGADDPLAIELATVWQRGSQELAIASTRTLPFLQWRARVWSVPFCVVLHDAEGPCAYALCSVDDGVGHLRDVFGTMDGITALMSQLPSLCYDRGLASVSFRYLGAPWLAKALEEAGFSLRPETRMIAISTGQAIAMAPSELTLAANWLLTDIDEDT